MVEESLVSDLEVIDYLELYNSTVEAARQLGISQSSCSRRYRAFSDRYGINFDRMSDRYQATTNLDVLASLRHASQKLRVRRGSTRICLGWQLGELDLPNLHKAGEVLSIRPMNSWRMLSILEQRLVDVAVMGLMEFEGLLGHPITRLRARPMPLGSSMLCVPIASFEWQLLAHRNHPLHAGAELNSEQLALFPSPALPLGMAPALMGALQNHGLASQQCGLHEYEELAWEGFARDGVALSYAAPNRVASLSSRFDLKRLSYNLDIRECIGLVGHRDVVGDASFSVTFNTCMTSLRAALGGQDTSIQWLS